ncbi:hypothetical protein FWF93_01970 [Candidatus Saccharibacteria bacterium]|nr:hypothetical protein [Candidatus Saccharibacteria bacterium]
MISLSPMIVVTLILIVLLGVFMLIFLSTTRKHVDALNKKEYGAEWQKIISSVDTSNGSTMQMAILAADKLLDKALKQIGTPGVTMGDRLKVSSHKFSKINDVWYAHKLRNQVAHEADFKLNVMTARKALAIFKRSLRELGAL